MSKVSMGTWIWDSDIDNPRVSTYKHYTFMSFKDIEGNDFITINGKELGEALQIVIIEETLKPDERLSDIMEAHGRWRIIFYGAKSLVGFAVSKANGLCFPEKIRTDVAVFLAPSKAIIEEMIGGIIDYLKYNHIDYRGRQNI